MFFLWLVDPFSPPVDEPPVEKMMGRPARYRFGAFLLDPPTLELSRSGESVHLEPLPTRILVALVERAGELVTRRELRELAWPRLPDAAEQSLNTCIRQIREALAHEPGGAAYVQTLRGHGYRFVEPVTVVSTDVDGPRRRSRAWGAAAAVALASVLVLGFGVLSWPPGKHGSVLRVAVPQARVVGGGPEADLLGEALADELRTALAGLAPGRIQVLGSASTRRLNGPDYGDRLPHGVDITHVLEATVRPVPGDALRVTARLRRRADGTLSWGTAVDAGPGTLGTAAAFLVRELASGVGVHTSGSEQAHMELALRERTALLKARYLIEEASEPDRALPIIDTLLASDPSLAPAHGSRAEALLFMGDTEGAAQSAAMALALNPAQPAAQRALAGVRMLEGEWREAESLLRAVLRRTPNDVPTLNALAFLLTARGRFAESWRVMERARDIDPLSPLLAGDAGLLHFWAGRYDDAAGACREATELRPDATWALGCVFDALVQSGRMEGAAAEVRHILEILGESADWGADAAPADLVARYRRMRIERWERAARGEGASAFGLALAYADARRWDDALTALEQAADHPTLAILTLGVDPRLQALSSDPRYQTLLRRFGLAAG